MKTIDIYVDLAKCQPPKEATGASFHGSHHESTHESIHESSHGTPNNRDGGRSGANLPGESLKPAETVLLHPAVITIYPGGGEAKNYRAQRTRRTTLRQALADILAQAEKVRAYGDH